MIKLTEAAANALPPAKASEVALLLELQAEWEELAVERQDSTARLQGVQRAFDLYRNRLLAYAGRDHGQALPGLHLNTPSRIGAWCRMARAVLLRAEGSAFPTHLMAKVRRVGDRLAVRLAVDPPAAPAAPDLAGAIQQLDAVIDWAAALAAKDRPAFEVGATAAA